MTVAAPIAMPLAVGVTVTLAVTGRTSSVVVIVTARIFTARIVTIAWRVARIVSRRVVAVPQVPLDITPVQAGRSMAVSPNPANAVGMTVRLGLGRLRESRKRDEKTERENDAGP